MRFVLFLIFVFTLTSCCDKKYCVELYAVSVRFYGFEPADVETVYSTAYMPGTYFTQIVRAKQADGVNPVKNDDGSYSFTSTTGQELEDSYDWELYIPATGQTYRINDYSFTKRPCKCVQDDVETLSGCRVNGITSPSDIKISK